MCASRLTGTDTLSAVHQDHRKDRHVPLGFNGFTVVLLVRQDGIVRRVHDVADDRRQLGVDITSRGVVLATLITGTELTVRHEQVHVVTADEVLRKVDDGSHQTLLAVVVGGNLRDVTDKLCDLCVGVLDANKLNQLWSRRALISLFRLRLKHDQITFL